ncbi:MAG: serine/threonine protein kinase [Polyangiales bacterium]|jgi:serine/threonine protein kinase
MIGTDMATPVTLSTGSEEQESIGRYRVLSRLAKGGMAEVLMGALDGAAGISRAVVIKRALPHLAEEPEFRAMFLDEAKLVVGLRHPNVVSVLELGEDDGALFLVMEYLEGEGLDQLSRRVRRNDMVLEPRLAAFIISQACAGLHAAHTHTDPDGEPLNIIHRDVSPHNIFLGYDGHVKLIDFGIAQSNIQDAKTQTGVVKGKLSYMAPEQLDRRPLDHRVDVFALGIVLWELLTGQRLFKRGSPMETVRAVCFDPIPGPLDVRDDIPVYLDGICRCALSRNPDHRYESAAAMRADLLKCISSLNQTGNEREELSRLLHKEFAENREEKQLMIRAIESGEAISTKDATGARALHPRGEQVALEPDSRPRPAWRWQALAFAGIAVATVVVAATLTGSAPILIGKSAAPEPAQPAQPTELATVVLHLTSTPSDAVVTVDGEARGRTPLDLTLVQGSEELSLTLTHDGYETASRTFVPDSTLRMELALVVVQPERDPDPRASERRAARMRQRSASMSRSDTMSTRVFRVD